MCTMISMQTAVSGSGKGATGWFPISLANVGYDHATHSQFDHALLLDFVNPDLGVGARVAVEMDIASGKALLTQLQAAIAEAERAGFTGYPRPAARQRAGAWARPGRAAPRVVPDPAPTAGRGGRRGL